MHTPRKAGAAAVLAATMIAATMIAATMTVTSAPAGAATTQPDTLSGIQARAAAATSSRITAIGQAIPRITANAYLSAEHRTQILGTLTSDLSAMQTLAAKIAADTTVTQARADYMSIFSDYRVFAVALPQAHFAAAADDLTDDALPELSTAHAALAAALSGPDKSKDTPQLNADLTDMAAKIAAAEQVINGVAADALGVTPADYDSNHAVLQPERSSVEAALADVRSARADANAIISALS